MNLKREVICTPCDFGDHRECKVARGMWRCVCACEKRPRWQRRRPDDEVVTWARRSAALLIVNDGDGYGHSIIGDFTVKLGPLAEREQSDPVEASAVNERSGQR